MWALFTLSTLTILGYFLNSIYRYFYPITFKSFEDDYVVDEYKLLCYHITFEDETIVDKLELTEDEITKIEKENKIKYIIIDYMFNGQFMKYITYDKEINFPFYNFTSMPTKYPYYPEMYILNGVDVTNYIVPYLGPYQNFYVDLGIVIKLEDILLGHPKYSEFVFDKGQLIAISNETPYEGKKCIARDLPCNLIWKRHAAVDPKHEKFESPFKLD